MKPSIAVPLLQIDDTGFLRETIADVIEFIPRLVGALLILLVGWFIGVAAGKIVERIVDRIELDRMVLDTPLGRPLGGTEDSVSNTFGTITKWFVFAVAVLAAANVLAIEQLSEWIAVVISYLPSFVAGLLVIVIGFVLADFIGDAIMGTRAATQTAYTSWFAAGTRMFLYFTAIVIGLDTMGIDVSILYLFAQALAWGLAAAIAIAVGVAFGWGGHTYVAENIDRWMGRASSGAPSPSGSSGSGGGAGGGSTTSAGGSSSGSTTSSGSDSTYTDSGTDSSPSDSDDGPMSRDD